MGILNCSHLPVPETLLFFFLSGTALLQYNTSRFTTLFSSTPVNVIKGQHVMYRKRTAVILKIQHDEAQSCTIKYCDDGHCADVRFEDVVGLKNTDYCTTCSHKSPSGMAICKSFLVRWSSIISLLVRRRVLFSAYISIS